MKRFQLAGLMAMLCFLVGLTYAAAQNPASWLFQAVAFIYLIAMIKIED